MMIELWLVMAMVRREGQDHRVAMTGVMAARQDGDGAIYAASPPALHLIFFSAFCFLDTLPRYNTMEFERLACLAITYTTKPSDVVKTTHL